MDTEIVSREEYENRHTVKIVVESRRGEQKTYERAYGAEVTDDGGVRVQWPDPTSEIDEQCVDEYGMDWRIVEVRGMNAGPFEDSTELQQGDQVVFVDRTVHPDVPEQIKRGVVEGVVGDEVTVTAEPPGEQIVIGRDDIRQITRQNEEDE